MMLPCCSHLVANSSMLYMNDTHPVHPIMCRAVVDLLSHSIVALHPHHMHTQTDQELKSALGAHMEAVTGLSERERRALAAERRMVQQLPTDSAVQRYASCELTQTLFPGCGGGRNYFSSSSAAYPHIGSARSGSFLPQSRCVLLVWRKSSRCGAL